MDDTHYTCIFSIAKIVHRQFANKYFTLSSLHFVSGNAASSILFAFSCRYILMKIASNRSYLRIQNYGFLATTLIFRSCISTKVIFLFEKVPIVEIFFGFEQRRFDHFVSIVTLNSIDFLRNMCKRKIGQMSAFCKNFNFDLKLSHFTQQLFEI